MTKTTSELNAYKRIGSQYTTLDEQTKDSMSFNLDEQTKDSMSFNIDVTYTKTVLAIINVDLFHGFKSLCKL